jgi:osmotically-inducible protein OsmY
MDSVQFRRLMLPAAACLVLAGCTQQDTETLARIGRKFVDRSHGAADSICRHVEGDLKGLPRPGSATKECCLKEKIEARLRWDALLKDVKVEVQVNGGEVDLKGTVKNEAQRRRTADLVETTCGVQAVNDGLKVEEP